MRIAIIGSGIAGLTAAYRLHGTHDITLFEAGNRLGGHTHTRDVEIAGRRYPVDTGFIVFNNRTYPHFIALLDELGVASRDTVMSFSVCCAGTGLEYNGTNLNALFAQRRNLLRPSFYRMLADILRFNREAAEWLDRLDGAAGNETTPDKLTLGEFLYNGRFGRPFIDRYIVPMGAAIWSTDPERMLTMPARFFIRFFRNHGLLSVKDQPRWRVIEGGSRRYVEALTAPFRDRIRLNCPVIGIRRTERRVELRTADGALETFDQVVIATHSDQALRLLDDPSPVERAILGAIPYQANDVVLHTDARLLPRRKLARAAWNYHIPREPTRRVAVTYDMNRLQGLDAPETFCVTLNHDGPIDPSRVLERLTYHHPVFTPEAVAAQARRAEINGVDRTWYCGAYWRNGFHEDGVVSTLDIVDALTDRTRLAA